MGSSIPRKICKTDFKEGMKLVIGLGNPGSKHQNNRHNVGHMVVDALATFKGLTLLKSDKFMNDSGFFVAEKLKAYSLQPTALYIIHDDLDIKLGEYKIQLGKGPKEHKGLVSIYEALGTREFWHVRVGIDPTSRGALRGDDIVLSDFTKDEKIILDKVIKQICKKLAVL